MTDTQHSHPKHPSQPSPHGVTGAGQYSCPACSQQFDQPGSYTTTTDGKPVPWYRPCPSVWGCPHCHAPLVWQPDTHTPEKTQIAASIFCIFLTNFLQTRPPSVRTHDTEGPFLVALWSVIIITIVAHLIRTQPGPRTPGTWALMPVTKAKAPWSWKSLWPVPCFLLFFWMISPRISPLPPQQQELVWWLSLSMTIIANGYFLVRLRPRTNTVDKPKP